MKIRILFFLVFLLFNTVILSAQNIFKEGYEKTNPVAANSTLSEDEKIQIHQIFLSKAVEKHDTLTQIYGLFYLFKDYAIKNDYPAATENVLKAELLANASGNLGWQGMVNHLKAIIQVKLKNFEASLKFYQKAADLCGKAGDSLCLAESLEQLGTINGQLKHAEEAIIYYNLAIPLIKKYGNEFSLATTLNNYGNFLLKNEKPDEAIAYYNQSIDIYNKERKIKEEAQALNNLASAFVQKKQYEQALSTYNKAIQLNNEFNMPENLVSNYQGMAELYKQKGEYKKAFIYLNDYQILNDSITGKEVQNRVTDLTFKFNLKEKELDLKKSQLVITEVKKDIQQRNFTILIICLLLTGVIIFWYFQMSKKKKEIKLHQGNLKLLSNVLLSKNTQLTKLEKELASVTKEKSQLINSEEFDQLLYNTRILTDDEWATFKYQYEKAYPGYLLRLRKNFPELTDSEERLFLLLRENLKSKEIASMLGISADSVKKTRSRLRKRLAIEQEKDLEEYVHSF